MAKNKHGKTAEMIAKRMYRAKVAEFLKSKTPKYGAYGAAGPDSSSSESPSSDSQWRMP